MEFMFFHSTNQKTLIAWNVTVVKSRMVIDRSRVTFQVSRRELWNDLVHHPLKNKIRTSCRKKLYPQFQSLQFPIKKIIASFTGTRGIKNNMVWCLVLSSSMTTLNSWMISGLLSGHFNLEKSLEMWSLMLGYYILSWSIVWRWIMINIGPLYIIIVIWSDSAIFKIKHSSRESMFYFTCLILIKYKSKLYR